MPEKQQKTPVLIRVWFGLTRSEKWFLFALLAITLIGSVVRYFHLKNQQPLPYDPEHLNRSALEKINE